MGGWEETQKKESRKRKIDDSRLDKVATGKISPSKQINLTIKEEIKFGNNKIQRTIK